MGQAGTLLNIDSAASVYFLPDFFYRADSCRWGSTACTSGYNQCKCGEKRMYGKAVLPFFLCRVRDVFFLFLNIVHVTDSNII